MTNDDEKEKKKQVQVWWPNNSAYLHNYTRPRDIGRDRCNAGLLEGNEQSDLIQYVGYLDLVCQN